MLRIRLVTICVLSILVFHPVGVRASHAEEESPAVSGERPVDGKDGHKEIRGAKAEKLRAQVDVIWTRFTTKSSEKGGISFFRKSTDFSVRGGTKAEQMAALEDHWRQNEMKDEIQELARVAFSDPNPKNAEKNLDALYKYGPLLPNYLGQALDNSSPRLEPFPGFLDLFLKRAQKETRRERIENMFNFRQPRPATEMEGEVRAADAKKFTAITEALLADPSKGPDGLSREEAMDFLVKSARVGTLQFEAHLQTIKNPSRWLEPGYPEPFNTELQKAMDREWKKRFVKAATDAQPPGTTLSPEQQKRIAEYFTYIAVNHHETKVVDNSVLPVDQTPRALPLLGTDPATVAAASRTAQRLIQENENYLRDSDREDRYHQDEHNPSISGYALNGAVKITIGVGTEKEVQAIYTALKAASGLSPEQNILRHAGDFGRSVSVGYLSRIRANPFFNETAARDALVQVVADQNAGLMGKSPSEVARAKRALLGLMSKDPKNDAKRELFLSTLVAISSTDTVRTLLGSYASADDIAVLTRLKNP